MTHRITNRQDVLSNIAWAFGFVAKEAALYLGESLAEVIKTRVEGMREGRKKS